MFLIKDQIREWSSGKLVEYESLRVSNGPVDSGRVGSKMVKLRVDMYKISIFQPRIPCNYWNSWVWVGSNSSKMVKVQVGYVF